MKYFLSPKMYMFILQDDCSLISLSLGAALGFSFLLCPHHHGFVALFLETFDLVCGRSEPGKANGQEAETVEDAKNDNEQIHAEVVELEEGRWSKCEDKNTEELGGGNTGDD